MIAAVRDGAREHALEIFGILETTAKDPIPASYRSLILLGPEEPGFWAHFTASHEWKDGCTDAMDRWSHRVISELATRFDAMPLFPFGADPPAPFIQWALRSGRAWQSPVSLLVHDRAGLFLSFRGALAMRMRAPKSATVTSPCATCATRPCLDACPAYALAPTGYDLSACHEFLNSPPGRACMGQGCAVRRSCPVSQSYARNPAQSAYHMKAFHP